MSRTANLGQFGTIVLGIRAYDTRDDLKKNNQRLLDYARDGGTLMVQYNTEPSNFNAGNFMPYPAQLSRARVAVEEAPITILDPKSPVFHYPNVITRHDFDGWVQERGLYFMDKWDDHYTPPIGVQRPRRGPAKGRLAGRALWQRLLHLQCVCLFPPIAIRSPRRDPSLCQPAKRGT